jgi:hypothetical protein
MVKNSKQKNQSKMPLGWMMLFAIIWPILISLLIHGHLFDILITNLSTNSANFVIETVVLLPPAIALFPLAYQIDALYNTQKRPAQLPKWQRGIIGILATALALWILWYVYIFSSIALTV